MTEQGFWHEITNTAWWQLLVIITTASLTQFFTYVFLARREKRQKIIEVATSVINSGASIRSRLSMYKQSELGFEDAQQFLQQALKEKDERIFSHHQQATYLAHKDAVESQNSYEQSRIKFRESAYLLRNMCYERLGENKNFEKAVNTMLDPKIGTHKDVDSIKKDVKTKLDKSMQQIESLCGREIYLSSRSWRMIVDDVASAIWRKIARKKR